MENEDILDENENEEGGDLQMGSEEREAMENISADRAIPETDELQTMMQKAFNSSSIQKKKNLFSQLQDFFFAMSGKIFFKSNIFNHYS